MCGGPILTLGPTPPWPGVRQGMLHPHCKSHSHIPPTTTQCGDMESRVLACDLSLTYLPLATFTSFPSLPLNTQSTKEAATSSSIVCFDGNLLISAQDFESTTLYCTELFLAVCRLSITILILSFELFGNALGQDNQLLNGPCF